MDTINDIEQYLGVKLPDDYRAFLLREVTFSLRNRFFCRILQDGWRTDGVVDRLYTLENFLVEQKYREDLIEFQTHFENPDTYVEAQYLYFIGDGSGAICIALAAQHYGKIYSVDNGDFGIIYQADSIGGFLDTLYNPSKYRCTNIEIIEAVKLNNLALLSEFIEKKDGDKQIEHSSWLDTELFDIAYRGGFDDILQYLMSRGYTGHNRVSRYKLKYDKS